MSLDAVRMAGDLREHIVQGLTLRVILPFPVPSMRSGLKWFSLVENQELIPKAMII